MSLDDSGLPDKQKSYKKTIQQSTNFNYRVIKNENNGEKTSIMHQIIIRLGLWCLTPL